MTNSDWISVNDRLPPFIEDVFICYEEWGKYWLSMGYYDGFIVRNGIGRWFFTSDRDVYNEYLRPSSVAYWMPLPDLPDLPEE